MRKMYLKLMLCLMIFVFLMIGSSFGNEQLQIKFYDLDVGFYPDARMDFAGLIEVLEGVKPGWNKEGSMGIYPHMKGEVKVAIDLGNTPTDSLIFYLHSELRVHKVKFGHKDLKFTQKIVYYSYNYSEVAKEVKFEINGLTGEQQFSIVYGGVFHPNYARAPSNYMRIDAKGAYLRSYGYSLWFPIFLKDNETSYPVIFKAKITVPEKFMAVLTGQRISNKIENNYQVSNWRGDNIELSDMQVTVRPFKIIIKEGIHIYHLPSARSKAVTRDIFDFIQKLKISFEENFKKIKNSSQLHIAELPNYASGISSGNMMGMTTGQWQNFSLKSNDDGLKLLVAHELIHPYVRVKVDNKNPLSALIVEGFPSYFHLHILAGMMGEEWYNRYMGYVEEAYIRKRKTKKTRWGTVLPAEKSILSLTYGDIGAYKDTFILNDRVRLFLNYLRKNMGIEKFKYFTRKLFSISGITVNTFKKLIQEYLPGTDQDINIWLETNDFPERFQLKK